MAKIVDKNKIELDLLYVQEVINRMQKDLREMDKEIKRLRTTAARIGREAAR